MRRNHGFSRVLGVIVAGCLLVSGFIASPANAAEDIKKSVQSQKIMDERPAALDENTPSTFSERSNEPVSSVTGVTLGDGYKARTVTAWKFGQSVLRHQKRSETEPDGKKKKKRVSFNRHI